MVPQLQLLAPPSQDAGTWRWWKPLHLAHFEKSLPFEEQKHHASLFAKSSALTGLAETPRSAAAPSLSTTNIVLDPLRPTINCGSRDGHCYSSWFDNRA